MEMPINNLCNSCTNIRCEFQSGIVRTKCAFYMPPHIEPDNCGKYVVMQPTVEAIPKADYETRLKADMVTILEDLQSKFEDLDPNYDYNTYYAALRDCSNLTQQKIDKLREGEL